MRRRRAVRRPLRTAPRTIMEMKYFLSRSVSSQSPGEGGSVEAAVVMAVVVVSASVSAAVTAMTTGTDVLLPSGLCSTAWWTNIYPPPLT